MTNDPNSNHHTKTVSKRGYDLEARTLDFAKRTIRLCKTLTPTTVNREIVSQLVRACGSVGANYREANEALSKKDFGYRIRISRKEAKEAHFWLQLLEEAEPSANSDVRPLQEEALELKKIFSTIAEKTSL